MSVEPAPDVAADLEGLTSALRQSSRDLYLATLLMPQSIRPLAVALFSYHVELSNIARQVLEPMAGAIRLQWWEDVFNGERDGEAAGHPLARSLLALMQEHDLATQVLAHKAAAHEFELYAEPMENRTMLEGFFGQTRSVLFQLLATALKAQNADNSIDVSTMADVAGHAGVSTGIVASLFDVQRLRNQQQSVVPRDILAATGLTLESFLAGDDQEASPAIEALIELGWEHHEKAMAAMAVLPQAYRPVFNLCSLTPAYLKLGQSNLRKDRLDIAPLGQIRTQWLLFRHG